MIFFSILISPSQRDLNISNNLYIPWTSKNFEIQGMVKIGVFQGWSINRYSFFGINFILRKEFFLNLHSSFPS